MARMVSTHPMDDDRIRKTEQEIQKILPARPEYVISTSEYRAMRDRVIGLENRRKSDDQNGRPRLRVAPGSGAPPQQDDPDQRPTIRRRDLVE